MLTYGLQNSTATENPETEKIKSLFEQYKKEMKWIRNLSDRSLKGYQQVFNRWVKYIGQVPSEQNLSQLISDNRFSRSCCLRKIC
jgi:hypothetical protein